jgi:hypothetical protein
VTDSEPAVTETASVIGGGVSGPDHSATPVDEQDPLNDLDLTPAPPAGPNPPQRGDVLTTYTLAQAAPFLGIAPDTLRRLIHHNLIPRHFLSKPTPGKTMLSADAIHGLADWFREVDWAALREQPPPGARPHRGWPPPS